jgi:hypothetical protein
MQRIAWLGNEILIFQESFRTIDLDGQEVMLHDCCSKRDVELNCQVAISLFHSTP